MYGMDDDEVDYMGGAGARYGGYKVGGYGGYKTEVPDYSVRKTGGYGDYAEAIGYNSRYGDRTPDMTSYDRMYDSDRTGDRRDIRPYDNNNRAGLNMDRMYDDEMTMNRRDQGGINMDRRYDADSTRGLAGYGMSQQ